MDSSDYRNTRESQKIVILRLWIQSVNHLPFSYGVVFASVFLWLVQIDTNHQGFSRPLIAIDFGRQIIIFLNISNHTEPAQIELDHMHLNEIATRGHQSYAIVVTTFWGRPEDAIPNLLDRLSNRLAPARI